MLKNFATWFIVFGLSFLVSNVFNWTEQGKAFMYIHLGICIIIGIILCIIAIIVGFATNSEYEAKIIAIWAVIRIVLTTAIIVFTTWGATKLFNIDFFVAYQIMTFGQCLSTDNKNKDD